MVESEVSGIAFSVHPVTQDRNQMIIEASYGLGEAIVSGQITPDSYVVEKKGMVILDKTIATKERGMFRASKGGNEWQTISSEKQEQQALSDSEILELSKMIIKIENNYAFPCDIEWAKEKGKFYIVQSRPITTLVELSREGTEIGKEKLEKVKLEKVYSGEHSLFYIYVWNNSDILAYEIKNLLFLREYGGDVVSVWYNQDELNSIIKKIVNRLNTENGYVEEVKKTFYRYLPELKPYLIKQKEVSNIDELKKYFDSLTKWWSVMAIIVATSDSSELKESIKNEFLKMCDETQEYSDEADNVFIRFFSKKYPQYKHMMLLMKPEEIFVLKKKKT